MTIALKSKATSTAFSRVDGVDRIDAERRLLSRRRVKTETRKTNGSHCWEYTGCKTKDGYGKIKFGGRDTYAHRLALFLLGGDATFTLDDEREALHSCVDDCPACFNPAHLRPGFKSENSNDRVERERRGVATRAATFTKAEIVSVRRYVKRYGPGAISRWAHAHGKSYRQARQVCAGVRYDASKQEPIKLGRGAQRAAEQKKLVHGVDPDEIPF